MLDTGPLIGLLSGEDEHHTASIAAIQASGRRGQKLCTIWEVVGEAYTLFRMRSHLHGPPALPWRVCVTAQKRVQRPEYQPSC